MTKTEFLARCEMAWDAGLIGDNRDMLRLLYNWTDYTLRVEGNQPDIAEEIMYEERKRDGFGLLASDTLGYRVVTFAALLAHPCQKCATDRDAWWTRFGFCTHKEVDNG